MTRKRPDNIRYFTALGVLLGAFLFVSLWSPGKAVPPKKALSRLPSEIGGWRGRDVGIPKEVLAVARVDDHIMRNYYPEEVAPGSLAAPVNLYVGYYGTQRKGSTYHSPRNCLPGGGWEIIRIERVPLNLAGKERVVNKVLVQKGLEKQLVLYWYQDRGRIIASEYWAKLYLVYDSIRRRRSDGAMVRIVSPVVRGVDETLEYEQAFVEDLFPYLIEHLPD